MSGQWLTCLGSSLERHLGNLEEKKGARRRARERDVTKTVILIKVQFYYFRHSVMKQGKGPPIPAKSSWSKVAGEHVIALEQLVGRQRQWEWQDDRGASSAPCSLTLKPEQTCFRLGRGGYRRELAGPHLMLWSRFPECL